MLGEHPLARAPLVLHASTKRVPGHTSQTVFAEQLADHGHWGAMT
jgi:hypothetical protein